MKFYAFLLILVMFLPIFALSSFAEDELFVGVSPQIINLGELERGTTNIVKFYVVTVSEKPLLVYLETEKGLIDFFKNRYASFIFNYSEEDTVEWIKFLSNPVELKSQNETLKTGYESIKGWREVDFLLEVPKDAEPGYHLVKINPNPSATTEISGGVGTRIVAMTSISIIYKVPGEAIRDGIILDTVPGNYRTNELGIDTYFQNTGTTTIIAMATQKIYDNDGNFITEIYSAKEALKPKEVRNLKSFLPLTGLSFGDYKVFTEVSYTTGSSYKNSTIPITQEALVAAKPKPEEFPYWIYIVIIIILAFIIYRWIH
jgi:hypothetical protein